MVSKKLLYIMCSPLLALPIYTWYKYFKAKKKAEIDSQKLREFISKHNCVVMYRRNHGMFGWGQSSFSIKATPATYNVLFEPIIYFLNTAEESVDVAVMLLSVQPIWKVLQNLLERGVKVRMVLDHASMIWENVNTLLKLGASIRYYVNLHGNGDSFMHHKFAVKDFSKGKGYLCLGSLNWTMSGFLENYEDLVFTSDIELVEEFYKHFEVMWDSVKEMENNVTVKTILNLKLH